MKNVFIFLSLSKPIIRLPCHLASTEDTGTVSPKGGGDTHVLGVDGAFSTGGGEHKAHHQSGWSSHIPSSSTLLYHGVIALIGISYVQNRRIDC